MHPSRPSECPRERLRLAIFDGRIFFPGECVREEQAPGGKPWARNAFYITVPYAVTLTNGTPSASLRALCKAYNG